MHVVIHARPRLVAIGPSVQIERKLLQTLRPTPAQLAAAFPVAFEEAYAYLERIPRMFIEPDGSFVWRGAHPDDAPPIDGLLADHHGRLTTVELKGGLSGGTLDVLLPAVGWPAAPVMFQLAREGMYLDEDGMRGFFD
jgi:hypothetical protein